MQPSSAPADHVSQAVLRRWFIARLDFESHSEFALCGHVYGHRRLRNGHPAMTSAVLELSSDDSWARTLNTVYWLFEPVGPDSMDRAWDVLLPLLAMKCSAGHFTRLRGVEGGVSWPHCRSPASKFSNPTVN